jgi:hypothetical protein
MNDKNDYLLLLDCLFITWAANQGLLPVVSIPPMSQWSYIKVFQTEPDFADMVVNAVISLREHNIQLKGILRDIRDRQFSPGLVHKVFKIVDSLRCESSCVKEGDSSFPSGSRFL